MASLELIVRVQNAAKKKGLNPATYTEDLILERERDAVRKGMTYQEFADMLWQEVMQ